ncbi:hypothetical protein [Streptomyces rubellomurinus]|uniref:Uncharacterized protein n=2 Tax=Streptomyces TaxID=1883 RepID=A0A0F2T866_STRR3|nr:hypothetical protein [Streptomyces rubellomurinus]KJS55654.1 hypothetical protein VM98_11740 [Streptomyces rubellomurinus subsp. indigoferus]KJS59429.1 hypothetical protein VM95_27475 [Streptomyces rubellomurinus]
MRALLEVELDTATSNKLVSDGSITEGVQQMLAQLKPEAAYFLNRRGRRSMVMVVNVADEASLPSIAEPFWQQLNATVDLHICMTADELFEGLRRLKG